VTAPAATRQLRREEARYLAVESPTALGHTSTVTVIDAARAVRPIDRVLLQREVAARLSRLPTFRKVLVEVPLRLDRPWWADDPSFDLDYHIRHIAAPAGGDEAGFAELVARIHSRPLDRKRPLWELYLIEGLADGRAAILTKVHLAALADSTGDDLVAALVEPQPTLIDEAPPRWKPGGRPSAAAITCRAWQNAFLDPARAMTAVPKRLRELPLARALVNPTLALLNQWNPQQSIAVTETATPAPRTAFNRRVGPHRRWSATTIEFDRIRTVRRAFAVSVIDVVAAMVAGALRWWLVEHDDLPQSPLRALVPLSVDDPEAVDGLAGVVIDLATNQHDPVERLITISAELGEAARRHRALPSAEIRGLGGGTPLLGMVASRLLEHSPLIDRLAPPFNTVITSVPGPDEPRFALGAPVEGIFPILGVVDGMGLHVGAISVGSRICLSLTSDRDLVADLDQVVARLGEELAVLEAAALERAS
jgi:diacylglycerol O-acyltransferase / wax synthase